MLRQMLWLAASFLGGLSMYFVGVISEAGDSSPWQVLIKLFVLIAYPAAVHRQIGEYFGVFTEKSLRMLFIRTLAQVLCMMAGMIIVTGEFTFEMLLFTGLLSVFTMVMAIISFRLATQ